MNARRKPRRRISHEDRLTWLSIGAVAPAALIALCLLWFGDYSAKVQWTLTLVIGGFAFGYIVSLREHAVRPWQTVTNLLAALREGDYSIRARGARENDALGEALLEVNELGETLRVQRLGAFEATERRANFAWMSVWRRMKTRRSPSPFPARPDVGACGAAPFASTGCLMSYSCSQI
jgi:hypothetical protein